VYDNVITFFITNLAHFLLLCHILHCSIALKLIFCFMTFLAPSYWNFWFNIHDHNTKPSKLVISKSNNLSSPYNKNVTDVYKLPRELKECQSYLLFVINIKLNDFLLWKSTILRKWLLAAGSLKLHFLPLTRNVTNILSYIYNIWLV
jgi:hypothetical protein